MIEYISFSSLAIKEYTSWANSDKKIFNKINKLIKVIQRTPYEGEGKPEALKHELSGYWARRITDKHRLVYKIDNEHVYIAKCRGHY